MKKLTTLIGICILCSCSNPKNEAPIKKVVCGDSVETEMFDENGTAFTVRIPGKCDTVLVTEEK